MFRICRTAGLEEDLVADAGPKGCHTLVLGRLSGELAVLQHLGAQSAVDGCPSVLKIMSEYERRIILRGTQVDNGNIAGRPHRGKRPFHLVYYGAYRTHFDPVRNLSWLVFSLPDHGEHFSIRASQSRKIGLDLLAARIEGYDVQFIPGESLVHHRIRPVRIGNIFPIARVAHGRRFLAEGKNLAHVVQHRAGILFLSLYSQESSVSVNGKEKVFGSAGGKTGIPAVRPLHRGAGA